MLITIKLSYYYTTIYFACICSILAVITGYRNRKKFKELKFFYLYPLASFIQISISYILIIQDTDVDIQAKFARAAETAFLLIEFSIINDFFRKLVKLPKLKKLLKVNVLLYFAAIILSRVDNFLSFPVHFFVIQACFILIPTFAYFFDLFKNAVTLNLLADFSFWIAVGIIFYFSCTLPMFLLIDYIYSEWTVHETNLYSINFICYGILFLFVTKAYLCPKQSTT